MRPTSVEWCGSTIVWPRIIAGGRPNQVITTLDFRPELGWPPGLYAVAPWLRARLIVTSELPRTDETLLLRVLGAGKTLRLAQADLAARVSTDPVAAVALPIMVRLHLEYLDHPEQPVDPETLEFLMATSDIYAKWQQKFREEGKAEGKAEGRAEGKAEGEASALLAVLSARGVDRDRGPGDPNSELQRSRAPRALAPSRRLRLFH